MIIYLYISFDIRDKFPFFIVHMLYLSSHIPSSSVFYSSILSEFLRTAQCTPRLTYFVPKASQFYTRMVTQSGNKANVLQIKAFQRYPEEFFRYCKIYGEIINKIFM